MQLTRVSIPISIDEREALRTLAKTEQRDPRYFFRCLLQQELVRRGFLPTNESSDVTTGQGLHVAAQSINSAPLQSKVN